MYDIIIIGAGPSGVSASLYAKRAGANVLILYYGESSVRKAHKIDNYYGFENGIAGKDLYKNGILQAKNLGIDVKNQEVLNINIKDKNFEIETVEENYIARTVIIATGNKKLEPNIKGIQEFEGKGVSYCAICDGFFYKNKNVVVIGDGNYALKEAEDLKQIANNVTILTNGTKGIDFKNYNVNTKRIKEIHGNKKVESIEFSDGSSIETDGVFIAIGEASASNFAKKIGLTLNNDSIIVDENMQTNIQGIYSCGNSTGGLLQICKAVYEGAKAGLGAANYLKNNVK